MEGLVVNIFDKLSKYDLISFDIFDTLLFRTVAKSIDVFELVWDKAEDIKLTDISSKEFVKLRMEMERRARNKKETREVSLKEIYEEFPDYIVSDKDKLLKLEVETEKECCYRNDSVYNIIVKLHDAGKKIVLLSDMYLDNNQICEILESNSININLFDEIIISNEKDCTKQTGNLFDELLKLYSDINIERIVHVGDNKNADYNQAVKKGITAIHYDAVPEKLNSIYDYEKIRHNTPQPEILSLRKTLVYENVGNYASDIEKQAYEVGAAVFGPFLTACISHTCDRLERLGIDRIYPFMREGYILGELLKNEASYRNMNLLVKPIYISRKVTYVPAIEKIDREEVENLIGTRNMTVGEAIHMFGLGIEDFSDVSEYYDLRWKEAHKYKKDNNTLKEYLICRFLEKQNVERIEAYVKEQRKYLINYIKQEIGDLNNIATIDIGFFGRIQQWLQKALDMEEKEYKIKHFLAMGVTGEKIYDGVDFEAYYGVLAENNDLITVIFRSPDIVEKFISVTEGSTVGYKWVNGRLEPEKSIAVANDNIVKASFKGILDYQAAFHAFSLKKPNAAKRVIANRRQNLMILHRLIDMPRLSEVKLVQQMEADTNFGTEYKKSIITEENCRILQEKGKDYVDKCNVSYTYKGSNIVWPKGVVTLNDEFYYVRRAMKSNATSEITKSMQEVVERVQNDGKTEIALYGAGENGRQFYFICKLYNIKVRCFIDRKASLWGTQKEGIPVMGLEEAMKLGCNDYIVTSLFSISEIVDYIRQKYMGFEIMPNIYSV